MESTKEKSHDPKKIIVHFNDQKFELEGTDYMGSRLYQIFGVPSENKLFRDVKNPNQRDEFILNDEKIIHVKSGERFYDLPPGTVGGDNPCYHV